LISEKWSLFFHARSVLIILLEQKSANREFWVFGTRGVHKWVSVRVDESSFFYNFHWNSFLVATPIAFVSTNYYKALSFVGLKINFFGPNGILYFFKVKSRKNVWIFDELVLCWNKISYKWRNSWKISIFLMKYLVAIY
jgi:hypothetical protein